MVHFCFHLIQLQNYNGGESVHTVFPKPLGIIFSIFLDSILVTWSALFGTSNSKSLQELEAVFVSLNWGYLQELVLTCFVWV